MRAQIADETGEEMRQMKQMKQMMRVWSTRVEGSATTMNVRYSGLVLFERYSHICHL